ncbi:MAG: hypothetical protein LBT79_01675 [Elusimicrobiota bacterium]|jgi:hypothetical protein|nr:hypothetical protein [Elusimicrobiota bacterium]
MKKIKISKNNKTQAIINPKDVSAAKKMRNINTDGISIFMQLVLRSGSIIDIGVASEAEASKILDEIYKNL